MNNSVIGFCYPSLFQEQIKKTPKNSRPVGSVGCVPDYRAGGRGFEPRPDQHSGSLNN